MRVLIALFLAIVLPVAPCAAQTWETVKSEGLAFEAEFPGKPEFNESTGDDGGMIRTYVVKSPAAAYDVTIYDLPEGAVGPEDVDRVLDNVRDRSVEGVSGELRTESKIAIGGHKARDLTADVMGMVWRSRLTIARNKIYQIVAIISKTEEQSESTMRYLTSFKLVEAAADSVPKK